MNEIVSKALSPQLLRQKALRNWHVSAAALPITTLVAALTALAFWAGATLGGPVMLYALVLGFAAQLARRDIGVLPGADFCAKTVLRFGVGMLGAGITVGQLADLGFATVALAVSGLALTIGLGVLGARMLGLSRNLGLLLGGAVAICGASAALAIASVLPRSKTSECETLLAVVGVTALSTLAMIAYPLLTTALGMDEVAAGIFFGAAIHDVAQVVGAGYLVSDTAGETATIVKLLRVACLVPVVALIGLYISRQSDGAGVAGVKATIVPWFLIMFVALSVAASIGLLPVATQNALSQLARILLTAAIVALGMKTSLSGLVSVGPKPVAVLVFATVGLAIFALGLLVAMPQAFGG